MYYFYTFKCYCIAGLSFEQAVEFAKKMEFSPACVEQAADYFTKLYNIFIERDATLIEINPMSEDLMGRGMCTWKYPTHSSFRLGLESRLGLASSFGLWEGWVGGWVGGFPKTWIDPIFGQAQGVN